MEGEAGHSLFFCTCGSRAETEGEIKNKIKIKGSGQECPLYMGRDVGFDY